MGFKDLVVFVDDNAASGPRCALAIDLARRHGAHLAGVHVMSLTEMRPYISDPRYKQVHRMLEEDAEERAAGAERIFKQELEREGMAAEWRVARVDSIHHGIVHARYADLAIVGQIDPNEHSMLEQELLPEDVLLSAGRPVLVVPYAAKTASLGQRVLVAWNASREAARAVNDALPLLVEAQSVTVLSVNPESEATGHGEVPGADIAVHLARHRLNVTVEKTQSSELTIIDILLNRVADLGADLLVTGGYGHSRTREVILGGATRELLQRMTVPVLMSH